MLQAVIAYALVAAAAAWVTWSMLLPRALKRRLRAVRPVVGSKVKDAGCACGDGGCKD